jgi:PadR family transcriptional regulator, regulatory protein PadR
MCPLRLFCFVDKYILQNANKSKPNPYISLTKHIQMAKEYLGEFEELVLTMVGILQEDAYGNAIVNEIKERIGRESNLSAVHVTLYRLEDKGFVKSSMGGATNARGGRRKRIFTITNAGLAILRAMKEQQMQLWKLVPRLNYDSMIK